MDKKWIPVFGYEDKYEVSNTGEVRNLKRGKIIKPFVNCESPVVVLFDANKNNGQPTRLRLRQVVYESFNKKAVNLPEIKCIDGNKANCNIENLTTCPKDFINCNKCIVCSKECLKEEIKRKSDKDYLERKRVIALNENLECVAEYKTEAEAAKCNGVSRQVIHTCCMPFGVNGMGISTTANGLFFVHGTKEKLESGNLDLTKQKSFLLYHKKGIYKEK